MVTAPARRGLVRWMQTKGLSERRGLQIMRMSPSALPADGNDMIGSRVEEMLIKQHGFKGLYKQRVMNEMLRVFDGWKVPADLPAGTAGRAEKPFATINQGFA